MSERKFSAGKEPAARQNTLFPAKHPDGEGQTDSTAGVAAALAKLAAGMEELAFKIRHVSNTMSAVPGDGGKAEISPAARKVAGESQPILKTGPVLTAKTLSGRFVCR